MRLAILSSHPIQYHSPLFRELARRMDVHVFFAHVASPSQQADAGFGVAFDWDVDLLSGFSWTLLKNVASQPGTSHFGGCDTPEIGSHIEAIRCDALLVMGWHLKSFVQGILAAKRWRIPVMVRGDSQLQTVRPPLRRAFKRLAYPALLRVFDAALYVGRRSRAYFEHYGIPERKLFYSPHCIDNAWFAARSGPQPRSLLRTRLGVADNETLVLFAGKLVPFKRPLDVLEAVALARKNCPRLAVLVAGDGELGSGMAELAASRPIPYHPLGFCNQTEMPAAYAASDMLVLPSTGRETWGLVANEALACGKPIIVSDVCGCADDLAADGVAGRSFAMGDVKALAQSIAAVAGNPPPDGVVAELAAKHSVEAAADGIIAAFENVVR